MSDLANELLADLDGLSDAEDIEEDENAPSGSGAGAGVPKAVDAADADMSDEEDAEGEAAAQDTVGSLVMDGGVRPAEELDVEDVQQMELGAVEDVSSVAKLDGSKRMGEILRVSRSYRSSHVRIFDMVSVRKLRSTRPILRRPPRWACRHTLIRSITSSFKLTTSRSMLTTRSCLSIRCAVCLCSTFR
jgi:hypothetical protein